MTTLALMKDIQMNKTDSRVLYYVSIMLLYGIASYLSSSAGKEITPLQYCSVMMYSVSEGKEDLIYAVSDSGNVYRAHTGQPTGEAGALP